MATTSKGTQVRLPQLGESVTEGTIGAWLKQVGDQVDKYEPLVEITTDKVAAEVPSPVSGVVTQIIAEEGETLPVGAEICIIDEEHGAGGPAIDSTEQPSPPPQAPAENGQVTQQSVASRASARPAGAHSETELLRIRSSPAVRRIAEEHGIEIAQVPGSGLEGRVTKKDILAYLDQREATETGAAPTEAAAAVAAAGSKAEAAADAAQDAIQETVSPPKPDEQQEQEKPETAQPEPRPAPHLAPVVEHSGPAARPHVVVHENDKVVPISPMRRQIADHMVRSERTAPHVTTWMEVDMTGVVDARARAKQRFAEDEGFDLTYLPFVIKAVVHALRAHPAVNAVWDETRIIQRKAVNIGVAVGMEDGLIVPVIKNADEKSIVGLARALHDLSNRARASRLTIDDVQGGTFTVNNPGTFGTIMSTPLIVQPQAAILSTEAIVKRPVVVHDSIAIRPMMNLSLSIDHRILDGMIAARFLNEIKRWLEEYKPDTPLY